MQSRRPRPGGKRKTAFPKYATFFTLPSPSLLPPVQPAANKAVHKQTQRHLCCSMHTGISLLYTFDKEDKEFWTAIFNLGRTTVRQSPPPPTFSVWMWKITSRLRPLPGR